MRSEGVGKYVTAEATICDPHSMNHLSRQSLNGTTESPNAHENAMFVDLQNYSLVKSHSPRYQLEAVYLYKALAISQKDSSCVILLNSTRKGRISYVLLE